MVEEQPWDKETAEKYIHQLVRARGLEIVKQYHAAQRMEERKILDGDIAYVLRNGAVIGEVEASSREGYFKYKIQCETPNSGGIIRLVVIPCLNPPMIKIITVMWVKRRGQA